jgi:hypothetical protein
MVGGIKGSRPKEKAKVKPNAFSLCLSEAILNQTMWMA